MKGAPPEQIGFSTIDQALEALRRGRPVLVLDDTDRENEGDVVAAAQTLTVPWLAWAVRHSSGYLCAPMTAERAERLRLPLMVSDNQDPRSTAYTVSCDAATGITTGISAADRTRTIRLLGDPATGPDDLIRPGHVLPLRARQGGVLERRGHTEATVDLARLAGLEPVGVIGELVRDDGSMMRTPDVLALGARDGLPVVTIADLAAWRAVHERLVDGRVDGRDDGDDEGRVVGGGDPATPLGELTELTTRAPDAPQGARVVRRSEAALPTVHGSFRIVGFEDLRDGAEIVALISPRGLGGRPLVRVHSECLTGDAFGSLRCDCGPQLHAALATVAEAGGAVIYVRGHEGRGVGLLAKLAAYHLQDGGADTVDAQLALGLPVDDREYGGAAAVLQDLGVRELVLLTNNPAKVTGLERCGLRVADRRPMHVVANPANATYLRTKRERMGHLLLSDLGLHGGRPLPTAPEDFAFPDNLAIAQGLALREDIRLDDDRTSAGGLNRRVARCGGDSGAATLERKD